MKTFRVKFLVPGFDIISIDVPARTILEAHIIAFDTIKSSQYHELFSMSARYNERRGEVSCLSVRMKK